MHLNPAGANLLPLKGRLSDISRSCCVQYLKHTHGWHANLMPETVLQELPAGWRQRATQRQIDRLELIVPAPADLLAPKLKRNEPRDRVHADWARRVGLLG